MKYIIGLVIAFLSGSASTWLFLNAEKSTQNTIPTSLSNVPNSIDYAAIAIELGDEVKKLKIENAQLNAQLTDTINSIANQMSDTSAEKNTNSTDTNLVEQELITYKLNEISTNIIEKIDGDLLGYANKLSADFDSEKKDIFWSEQQEIKLRTAISQDAELSDIAVREIECKTSQCKISVFSGNAEQNQEVFEKITRSVSKLYQNANYYSNPLENDGVKTIYFKAL